MFFTMHGPARRAGWRGLVVAMLASAVIAAGGEPSAVVEFFFEPGCSACRRIEAEVLPEMALRYGELVEVRKLSLNEDRHDLRLARYLDRCGVTDNAPVFFVVNGRTCLAGVDAIRAGAMPLLDQHLSRGIAPELLPDAPPSPEADRKLLARRMEAFTLASVIVGGLIDGLNPCALATLVFLLSVLAMARVSGRELLVVGGVFCLASFLAYLALGLGLLGAVHLLEAAGVWRRVLDAVMVVLLVGFAALSLRDAWVFARTAHADRMLLRLPAGLQHRVHRMVRSRLARRARLPAVFATGVLVTGLESVCTGQVYVPTLVLVARGGRNALPAVGYLLVYNLMFILPLGVTMLLAAGGMRWTRAAAWARHHVVAGKLLMAAFFLALAALLATLAAGHAAIR